MKAMDDICVRVTIEVTQRLASYDTKTIAKASVEQTCSITAEDLQAAVDEVLSDTRDRATKQLTNTLRIKDLEQRNALLAASKEIQ